MRATIGSLDPRLACVVPPGGTERILVHEKTADPFDEGLDFAFDRILMLMTWRCWMHDDAVVLE